ncbi:MAG: hypothetical protein V3V01_09535, partial [Acidimicrobiales bacterium]
NLPEQAAGFNGHVIVDAVVPVYAGLEIDGTTVIGVYDDHVQFGGEGAIQTSVPGVGSVALGYGAVGFTADARPGRERVEFWSSAATADEPIVIGFGDTEISFPANGQERSLSQFFATAPDSSGVWTVDPRSNFVVSGLSSFGVGALAELAGIDLSDMSVATATLRIGSEGIRLQGSVSRGIHPDIEFQGSARIDAFLSFADFADSSLEISGSFAIGGVDIGGQAMLSIDRHGFVVSGELVTPISRVELSGFINETGAQLSGTLEATLGLSALSDAAISGIDDAQREIDRLDTTIALMRNQVRKERRTADRGFRDAKAALGAAKAEVNKIRGNIDYNNRLIRGLETEYVNLEWYEWPRGLAILAEIAALGTANVAQEAALVVAIGVLDFAIEVLEGIRIVIDALPTDLDLRIVALFVARDAATVLLDIAREAAKAIDFGGNVHVELSFSLGTQGLIADASAQHCDGDGNNCVALAAASLTIAEYFEICVEPFGLPLCATI